jgi:lipopolysaccharide/colanic/teichoic acid biosynthesis glycosyltransferase
MAGRFAKRVFDVTLALSVLIVFSPLILGTALAIYLSMGRPVLFAQERPGKDGRIFTLYKFRSMAHAVDKHGNLLPDGDRLTRVGRFIRKTSLDELPQLWNVLKGEMSLVGPRPLLVVYLERYSPEQARRHEVTPGITGWAQVHGRRLLDGDWQRKFELDVWYVDNWSFWLDMKIIWMSLVQVLKQSDVAQEGHATGEEFKGNH